tara:strand:+ start:7417 stop:7710 length:294 start_codon:yes stop_codon:yes gene_type:complete
MANDKKVVDGVEVELTDAEQTSRDAEIKAYDDSAHTRAWASLRFERDQKLSDCDWMANSDITMSNAWKTYRQELRDLPASYDDTTVQGTITWPNKPS